MDRRKQLSRPATVAMIVTAVMLLSVFVAPLWVIHLKAPQYPQGLGINIWVNRIEGAAPHDLQNINGLNHYIGMQPIEPGQIPELRFMQYFAIGLSVLAGLTALIRRRWALIAWVVLAVALSGIGLYDFYQWEYDYGHNLNPNAAIKIEGMSYQPPMFGTKQLLNFHTTAWPGLGGILAMAAVAIALAALVLELRGRARKESPPAVSHAARKAAVVFTGLLTLLSYGCSRDPAPIAYGSDTCSYCSMTIANERYGAALVTDKGRTFKFDSIECMLWAREPGEALADTPVHLFYVVTYESPGTLHEASGVTFLASEALPSPMGANLTAFVSGQDAAHVQHVKTGEILDWDAVQSYVHSRRKT